MSVEFLTIYDQIWEPFWHDFSMILSYNSNTFPALIFGGLFYIILSDFWWTVKPKRFPKSDQNRSRICTFAPGHHLGRPWHVLVLIWCPFDAFWMTLVFVFPASVFRLFTHQTRHLVLSFNMENDQFIKAHLLRWFPAMFEKILFFGLSVLGSWHSIFQSK